MDGVIAIDKPAGPSSFAVVRAVRRALGVRKAGHTGTLDPFATGLLLVAVGRATGLIPWLQRGDKEYVADVLLGEATDTLDPTGQVVRTAAVPDLSPADVAKAIAGLTGMVMQVPPAHSAVKVAGRRAYRLAREGAAPDLAARPVLLRQAEVLAQQGPRIRLRLRTGPGYYVRSLARDLAEALGTAGRLDALRRTETGGFRAEEAVPLDVLCGDPAAARLVAMGDALRTLPATVLSADAAARVATGRLPEGWTHPADGDVRLLRPDGALCAIAALGGRLRVFDSPATSG